ncbi:divergent polysaccharide deacetylase family protein [Maricaulis sp. CAU 1757]
MIRSVHSAMPAFAGALVGLAYIVGGVVFSVSSQGGFDRGSESAERRVVEVPQMRHLGPVEATETEALPTPLEVAGDQVVALGSDAAHSAPPAPRTDRPRLAIVIDDVGLDTHAAARLIALDTTLTIAILPYAEAASEISAGAAQAGHDVLLHMPMEPLGLADPGPNVLRTGLSDADLQARLRWAMAQIPDAVGLNNHMGSRFTQDPRALRVALSAIAERRPLFLDSMTTAGSRGHAVAEGLGLPSLQRDIFLDHVINPATIADRLDEAEELARSRGWAVVIGHPHAATLDVLEAWISGAGERGVELVGVAELARDLEQARSVPVASTRAVGAAGSAHGSALQ